MEVVGGFTAEDDMTRFDVECEAIGVNCSDFGLKKFTKIV